MGSRMITIYSVAWLKDREIIHCDLVYDKDEIRLEYLASKWIGRSRKGLSKNLDLTLYKIEKMRTKSYGMKKTMDTIKVDEIICWKLEENREKGIGREYENSILFLLKSKKGVYRIIISKKAMHVLEELIKKLKRREIRPCKKL